MSAPKLHHYVPRFHLRRFQDATSNLWVFDKETQRAFRTTPKRIAAERHFYRVTDVIGTECDPLFLEREFSSLEGSVSTLTEHWLTTARAVRPARSVGVTSAGRHDMALYIALQYLRTMEQREILAAFAVEEGTYPMGISADEKANLHATMLWNSSLVHDIALRVYESIWVFGRNLSSTPFMTSDNPVCVKTPDNRMWLKAPGILSSGTYFVFPLSPDILLYCKEPKHWAKVRQYDTCVSPVDFTEEMVQHENSGQVFMASRFVISCDDDFGFVREFLPSIGTEMYAPEEPEG
jgi:hypothetical protein